MSCCVLHREFLGTSWTLHGRLVKKLLMFTNTWSKVGQQIRMQTRLTDPRVKQPMASNSGLLGTIRTAEKIQESRNPLTMKPKSTGSGWLFCRVRKRRVEPRVIMRQVSYVSFSFPGQRTLGKKWNKLRFFLFKCRIWGDGTDKFIVHRGRWQTECTKWKRWC